jgi:hypothetical protein
LAPVVAVVHWWALQMGTAWMAQVPIVVSQMQDWQVQTQMPHHLQES